MKRLFLFLAVAILVASCSKEDTEDVGSISVNGNLSGQITEQNIYKIKKLTITGTISGEDWNTLFEMAVMGSLEVLDMTNAVIEGSDEYDSWNDDAIPNYQFWSSKTLKEVYLPRTAKVIGTEAFAECPKLKLVHLPEQIDSIGPRAFHKSGLSGELILPTSLRVIGKQAFARTDLTKVVIPSDVVASRDTSVYTLGGNSVFAYCNKLSEVVVKEGCTMLEIGFSGCSSLTMVSLPRTLLYLGHLSDHTGNYLFSYCKNLASIDLPKGLRFIGMNAFKQTPLTAIGLPDSVECISSYAFSGCNLLEEVKMPAQLKQIGQGCFQECTSLSSISIPNSVSEIDYKAFEGCSALKSISLGDGLVSIGRSVFANCIRLESAEFPSCTTSIGKSAFEGCSSLIRVVLSDNLKTIESTTFKDCIELQDVYLGSSTLYIRSSAFYHCPKLSALIIPPSISVIDSYAFAYTSLRNVIVSWNMPVTITGSVFEGVNLSKATLEIPRGSIVIYQNSPVWMNFGSMTEI